MEIIGSVALVTGGASGLGAACVRRLSGQGMKVVILDRDVERGKALASELGLPDESYLQYLDLVATAIAADIVPISGENRAMAFFGLKKVKFAS